MANGNVEFCGRLPDEQLRGLYARCRALIMPGEEDFGLTSVEAVASGKAVVALGQGRVLESAPIENPRAGFFYYKPGDRGLEEAIRNFEKAEAFIVPEQLQRWAARFSEAQFADAISKAVSVHAAGHFHRNLTTLLRQAV